MCTGYCSLCSVDTGELSNVKLDTLYYRLSTGLLFRYHGSCLEPQTGTMWNASGPVTPLGVCKIVKCVRLSVYLSVRPSICPHRTIRLPLNGFSWKLISEFFPKIHCENSLFIKILQEQRTLHEAQYKFLIMSLSFLLRIRNVSCKRFRESQNIYFMLQKFFRKSCRLWDEVERHCSAGQTTNRNMTHAHCMLGT